MASLEIENLSKTYADGTRALAPTTLTLESGSLVVLLGPSGAGKSTLLRCINWLETPTTGTVRIDGTRLTARNLRSMRGAIGMVFQHFNLVDRLSVMTNILCGRLAKRSSLASLLYLARAQDVERARVLLAQVGLTDKAWQRADRLSGGEKQRVGIARALAQEPRLLLADEPVASLDPETGTEILELLQELSRATQLTTLVSLHQVEHARRFGERIIGLNAGCIVFDGPPESLDEAALDRIYRKEGGTNDADRLAVADG